MIAGKIKSKYIAQDIRFNGGYFLNEDAVNSRALEENSKQCSQLTELADVWNPPIFKRQFCQKTERAIPYCQSSDVTNALEGSDVFINKIQATKVGSVVEENQILITGFGTIGNTRLVNELSSGISYANNVCRVKANEGVLHGYLYAVLTSKYGRSQLNKNASGSVVRYIEAPGIKKTLIPNLPDSKQEEIHDLILEASNLRVEANKLLREAKDLFYNSCGITKEEIQELDTPLERNISLAHKVNIKDLSIHTFRGRNYSIRKQKILSILSKNKYDSLLDVLEKPLERGGRFKRVDVVSDSPNAVMLLNQGDIFDLKPKVKTISKKAIKNWSEEVTKKNLLLVPALGTLGENEIFSRVQFCYGYLENQTVAEGLMRIIPNENVIDPGYLFTVLSSDFWFRILRNSVHGTNLLGYIYPMLHSYPIPRLEKLNEKEIGDLVRSAYSNLTLALKLEQKAIDLVEKEIESWQK